MGAMSALPGGMGRFMPYRIGANHCGLRHAGWEKCGHGLTSRLRDFISCFSWRILGLPARFSLGAIRFGAMCLISLLREVRRSVLLMVLLVRIFVPVLVFCSGSAGGRWKNVRQSSKTPAYLVYQGALGPQSRTVFGRG